MPTTNKKQPTPAANSAFIDKALMERAIKLRREGKTMEQIGAALGVKATAYLAKKIKATYGPDALARATTQGKPQPKPAKGASAHPSRRRKGAAKPATAKEA